MNYCRFFSSTGAGEGLIKSLMKNMIQTKRANKCATRRYWIAKDIVMKGNRLQEGHRLKESISSFRIPKLTIANGVRNSVQERKLHSKKFSDFGPRDRKGEK